MSVYRAILPAQSAGGADAAVVMGVVETTGDNAANIVGAHVVPPLAFSTVTGQVTNNATISVRQVRAGSVVATLATLTTAVGNNLVAQTVKDLVLPAPQVAALANGDIIDCLLHQNSSGQALGVGLLVQLEIN